MIMGKDELPDSEATVDVLIVGSGNAGMTAALTAHIMGAGRVLIIEKSQYYGGTSAMSGGGVWIPCNPYARACTGNDSLAEAKQYVRAVVPEDECSDELLDAFLQQGPEMIGFLHNNTDVRYLSLEHYPDYFSGAPGAKPGHRSMEPVPFSSTILGEEFKHQHPPHPMVRYFGRIFFSQEEFHLLLAKLPGWFGIVVKQFLLYFLDIPLRLRGNQSRRLTMGAAGIARLRSSLLKRNIPLWRSTRLVEILSENNRVTGVIADRAGQRIKINVNKGVILTAGGFDHNREMREKHLPKPDNVNGAAGSKDNTGDAIIAANKIGASLRNMGKAWWITNIKVPGEDYPRLSIFEKSFPGSCVVNPRGRRISNESQGYNMFMRDLHKQHSDTNPCDPCYLIFDATHRRKYFVGPLMPGSIYPDFMIPNKFFSEGFLTKSDTITGLAAATGIDREGLEETIRKMNEYARTGKDLEFGRGDTLYDRYYSDPSVKPNSCLAPIAKPPFYAMRMLPGDLGTCGGLNIDTNARVLNEQNQPIAGLYAAGNCAAGILTTYPGPGATIGPAMTFAYIAAKHIHANTES